MQDSLNITCNTYVKHVLKYKIEVLITVNKSILGQLERYHINAFKTQHWSNENHTSNIHVTVYLQYTYRKRSKLQSANAFLRLLGLLQTQLSLSKYIQKGLVPNSSQKTRSLYKRKEYTSS